MGVMGLSWRDVENRTFRELIISQDAYLLDRWDHTATLSALIHNLGCVVVSVASKAKPKPKGPDHFHPFRFTKKDGMVITADSFQNLKMVGNLIAGGTVAKTGRS